MRSLEDRNLIAIDSLRTPAELKTLHPMSTTAARVVLRGRNAIRDVLHRRNRKRQIAIIGPCSLHDPVAALEYARRLVPLAKELEGELFVVMRTYFEKPRRA